MTTSKVHSRFRSLQWITAVGLLIVSGHLGYYLTIDHLWLTLATLGVKTCSTLALLPFLGCRNRAREPGFFQSFGVLVLMIASMSADFAVATLIHP